MYRYSVPADSLRVSGTGAFKVSLEAASVQNFNLTVGKSVIVRSSEKVKRVSLVAPEIVDALVLTPWQIYLAGRPRASPRSRCGRKRTR